MIARYCCVRARGMSHSIEAVFGWLLQACPDWMSIVQGRKRRALAANHQGENLEESVWFSAVGQAACLNSKTVALVRKLRR